MTSKGEMEKAENIAQQTSDGVKGRSDVDRHTGPADQMESNLELKKDSKQEIGSADNVAGRKGEGMGLVDKLVPGGSK